MSQVNGGGRQPQVNIPNADPAFTQHLTQILGNAANRVNNARPGNHVPQELQNARVSTSLFARIGHSIASFFATVGEGICALGARIFLSSETPKPRVNPGDKDALPFARPADMAANEALADGIYDMNLPDAHKGAFDKLLNEMRERYGDAAPKDFEALKELETNGTNYFPQEFRKAVRECPEHVSPQRLYHIAKDILEPFVAKLAIGHALKSRADELKIPMAGKSAEKATAFFLEDCKKAGLDVSLDSIPDLKSAQELVSKMADRAKDAVEKGSLAGAWHEHTLPPAHQKAMDAMLNDLRKNFGRDCLPKDFKAILNINIEWGQLRTELESLVNHPETPLSPQQLASKVKELLLPPLREQALCKALGRQLETKHGVTLHPDILSKAFQAGVESLKAEIPHINSYGDALKVLTRHTQKIDPMLAGIAKTVSEMDAKYLPQVNDEIRPLLKNYIHSLVWNDDRKAASEAMISSLAKDMASWKLSVPFGEKSLTAYCDKMASELVIFMNDNRVDMFTDDIFTSMDHDANRNNWKINGQDFDHPKAPTLVANLKTAAPNPADQRFLSKLVNQYLSTTVAGSLMKLWRFSETSVKGEELKNGLAFNPTFILGSVRQPSNVNNLQADEGYYSITISPDQKTAVIEVLCPNAICTDDQNPIQLGTVNQTLRIHCNLSGGESG